MNEKLAKLQEEEYFLKELLAQHVAMKDTIWKNREKEFREHIDAILDELNHIRREINQIMGLLNQEE
jgi:hypothetical protein